MKSPAANNAAPRYDLSLNPPYQINYRAKRAGKHISASKRRITFQFGFSSANAIARGLAGKECRGEEHEVVLIWSHVTGKRQLFMDSREIHMSKAARCNSKFECSWSIFGGHTMKIIANGTPPKQKGGERQFDLQLDGMSFFEFSKIYQLGCGANATESSYSFRGMTDARDDEEEEETEICKVDLFDAQPSSLIDCSLSSFSSVPSLVGSASLNSDGSYDEFAPVEYNTRGCMSDEILRAYNITTTASDAALPHSAPSSSRALVPLSDEGMDPISKSMKNLVNLDDITTSVVQPIVSSSPSLNTMKQGQANWSLIGRAPTLSEMRDSFATSPSAPARAATSTPIMQSFAPLPHQSTASPLQHGYSAATINSMNSAPAY